MSARPIATGNHLVPRHTTVNGTGLLVGLVAAMALAGYLIGFSPSDEVQNVRGQSCDGASHVRSQCIERRSAAGAVVMHGGSRVRRRRGRIGGGSAFDALGSHVRCPVTGLSAYVLDLV
jgi:hypothetical protein